VSSHSPLHPSATPPATSQGYVLPEGKIMPNTIFVGGIDIRMDESEIRSFFARYGTVKEVKIITDRTGVSKGYGFVSFLDNVDVQKIVESQINFHGKKLKLGPAIRKHPNLCTYHVPPRPVVINSPTPQFHSIWSNQETYMQPPAVMSPVTQYVQVTFLMECSLYTVNYAGEMDAGTDQAECSVVETVQSCAGSPQKKSVDRSIQTVVSCLCNPDNRLRNNIVTQEDYLKEKRAHHFRRSRAVLKSV
uniref:RRM domain-containing protein n=1 Tax=Salvator merianae TaxID=96440 RepID=A0A8D0AT20_SALMN